MRRVRGFLWTCAACLLCAAAGAEDDYAFDPSAFEKKAFEIGGYSELRWERFALNQQAALYQLNFFDQPARADFDRTIGVLQLEALYRAGITTAHFLGYGAYADDYTGGIGTTRIYEAYLNVQPSDRAGADIGKKALRWGKGYAWNPVGFVERPKDPNDPELAREGFVLAAGDFVRSFDGALRTVAFTPLLVPVYGEVNEDFGAPGHLNPAAKLYLLYRDTDIDFMLLGEGSRSARYGFDFSRNLRTNFEIHGEWAHITEAQRPVVDAAGNVVPVTDSANTWLLGLRHLSENELTTIIEYYHNGAGYTEEEFRALTAAVHDAYDQALIGNTVPLTRLRTAAQPSLARPNPMQRYLYLRVSQKEPFDILYFTPAFTAIVNRDDGSYSLAPELLYTGVTNLEVRARVLYLSDRSLSDFGEKQNERRVELRIRYYF